MLRLNGYSAGVMLLLAAALIYASTFVIIKEATTTIVPLSFVALRFAAAALALLPLAWSSLRAAPRAAWRVSIGAGVLFGAGFVFQTGALALIDAGRTGFITGLYVVGTPLLAYALFRYPLTLPTLISIALAVGGMALLSYAPGSSLAGDALALAAALTFAGHVLAVERFPRHLDWRFAAFAQCATVAVGATGLALVSGASLTVVSGAGWSAILFAGLAATALTLPIQVIAQRHVPPGHTALLFALEAPFAALFGVVLRGETITPPGLAGCALIFMATVIVTTAAPKRAAPAQPAEIHSAQR